MNLFPQDSRGRSTAGSAHISPPEKGKVSRACPHPNFLSCIAGRSKLAFVALRRLRPYPRSGLSESRFPGCAAVRNGEGGWKHSGPRIVASLRITDNSVVKKVAVEGGPLNYRVVVALPVGTWTGRSYFLVTAPGENPSSCVIRVARHSVTALACIPSAGYILAGLPAGRQALLTWTPWRIRKKRIYVGSLEDIEARSSF